MDELPQQVDVSAYIVQVEQGEPKSLNELFMERVLATPDMEPSLVPAAAAANGMDVVFGEVHDRTVEAHAEVSKLLQSQPYGHFGAVALEVPVEVQEILTPEALSSMTREEFKIEFQRLEMDSKVNTTHAMLNEGLIDADQYTLMMNVLPSSQFTDEYLEKKAAIYDVAQVALEQGVPVYAVDMERDRVIFHDLFLLGALSEEEYGEVIAKGMDDRSDVERLADMGVDLSEGSKPIIVNYGKTHIDNGMLYNGQEIDGFDDILEEYGRNVFTVGVINKGYVSIDGPDKLDVNILADKSGDTELVIGEYKPGFGKEFYLNQ